MIIAATGHRPNKLGGEYNHDGKYSRAIRTKMAEVIEEYKPEAVISGMALGVDTLWAMTAIVLNVPLIAAVPFVGQESHWPNESQQTYRYLLSKAHKVNIVSAGGYASWKMHARNMWMVDRCNVLLAFWDGTSGGTGNCVGYAQTRENVIILRYNPKDLIMKPH